MNEIFMSFLDNYIENKEYSKLEKKEDLNYISSKNFRIKLKKDSENVFKEVLKENLDKYDVECSLGRGPWANVP